ncbi:MAG TPA: hypothetical protein VJR58_30280 [Vineibacter sp.]|nr:hypothetical protein [Vineibacter sp.]
MIRRTFTLSAAAVALLPASARAADTVSGRYVGNGKDVRLAFASAYVREGMSGKPAVIVVMTEKDHSASKKPTFDADFGKFGSALTISLHRPDGGIFACQVAHQGLKRSPVSVIGTIKAEGVSFADDRIKARFTSKGPDKFFDDVFDVDVQVDAAIRPKLA